METQAQIHGLFIERVNSINKIWDFIVISFRHFGVPTGLHKSMYDEFQRLDNFYVEHSTLPINEFENIIDVFRHCVNKNENLLGQRRIEYQLPDTTTNLQDTDVVMDDSLVQRALNPQGSSSLPDLILSPAEIQMDTWKPNVQTVMHQFQEFDNEGYDINNVLFDVVQNSKMRFNQNKQIYLFGLKFTESPSASNWTNRSIETYDTLVLPTTFEELEKIPLDRAYNFLMSLDKNSIDKEIELLGVEAHMFWEKPEVRTAFNDICKKWFFNDCKAYSKNTIDISEDSQNLVSTDNTTTNPPVAVAPSQKEKEQSVELGFVEKLVELWRLRKRILEDKAEILVDGTLAKYAYKAGETLMNRTLTYRSSHMSKVFRARNKAITLEERKRGARIMYENYICQYKCILLQCEKDFDLMINVRLYKEIVIPHFNVKHGQYAAVALTRCGANLMLRKVWDAFINKRERIIARDHAKIIQSQKKFDDKLHAAQIPAGKQIDNRIDMRMADLDAKIKGVIKDTIKSRSIKKESLSNDPSMFEIEDSQEEEYTQQFLQPHPQSYHSSQSSFHTGKRFRQPDTVDLRSPNQNRRKKKQNPRPPSINPQGLHNFLTNYTIEIRF